MRLVAHLAFTYLPQLRPVRFDSSQKQKRGLSQVLQVLSRFLEVDILWPRWVARPGCEANDCTPSAPSAQDAQAQTVEKGVDSNDSQKSALGPRANAMTASSVSSS